MLLVSMLLSATLMIIQVEASMCHLRGILMLKLNRGDQAKQCFMEALALDVKCFEAFDQLVSGEMMAVDEGTLGYTDSSSVYNHLDRMGICAGTGIFATDSRRC